MGDAVNAGVPGETWRVAALTMMSAEDLHAAIGGDGAAAWIGAAALCGLAQAQLRLGRMLLEGEGVTQDRQAAFARFLAVADSGDAEAHNMLGRCLSKMAGAPASTARRAVHYRIAAEAGLDWAQYNLGTCCWPAMAWHATARRRSAWYGKAAAQGHVRAMNLVGRCLENGWGVARDPVHARAGIAARRRRLFPRRLQLRQPAGGRRLYRGRPALVRASLCGHAGTHAQQHDYCTFIPQRTSAARTGQRWA